MTTDIYKGFLALIVASTAAGSAIGEALDLNKGTHDHWLSGGLIGFAAGILAALVVTGMRQIQ